jgi:hypothetical protein
VVFSSVGLVSADLAGAASVVLVPADSEEDASVGLAAVESVVVLVTVDSGGSPIFFLSVDPVTVVSAAMVYIGRIVDPNKRIKKVNETTTVVLRQKISVFMMKRSFGIIEISLLAESKDN